MEPANELKIDSLTGEWADKDSVILHACFQILKDFVEKEDIEERRNNWDFTEEQKLAKAEIDKLYEWWMSYSGSGWRGDIEDYEIENSMLIRLIKVRKYLWT